MKKRDRTKNREEGKLEMKDCIIKKKLEKEIHKRLNSKGKTQKKKPQRKKQSFVAFIICACFYKNLNL